MKVAYLQHEITLTSYLEKSNNLTYDHEDSYCREKFSV